MKSLLANNAAHCVFCISRANAQISNSTPSTAENKNPSLFIACIFNAFPKRFMGLFWLLLKWWNNYIFFQKLDMKLDFIFKSATNAVHSTRSGEVVCSMFEICTLCWLMNATCAILKHLISNSGFFFFLLFIINQIKSTENSWCCLARFIEFQELCKNFNIAKSFE